MNFKQLEIFRAVVLSGSMTAAAEMLHTSQPNISRMIAQLEEDAGFRLFDRINGRLQTTNEAIALYSEVERAFVSLNAIEAAAQQIRQFGTGRLRISAPSSLSLTFLPRVIQQFRQRYPLVAVSLQTSNSPKASQAVAAQQCDFGVVSYIGAQTAGIDAEMICNVPGVLVLPPGHPLSRNAIVQPEALEGENFISMMPDDGARLRIDRYFEQSGVRRAMTIETPFAATICSMVGFGLGVSIVHPLVARDCLHTGIEVRRFAPSLYFTTHLLRPAHASTSVLAQSFIDLLKSMLEQDLKEWQ